MLGPRRMRTKMVYLWCFLFILHSCSAEKSPKQGQKDAVDKSDSLGAGHNDKPVSSQKQHTDSSPDKNNGDNLGDGLQPDAGAPAFGTLDDDDTGTSRGSETPDPDNRGGDEARDEDSTPVKKSTPTETEVVDESEGEDEDDEEEDEPGPSPQASAATMQHIYKAMFSARRSQHKEAVNTITSMPDVEKQFKMLTLVLEKMHKVMTEQRVKLTESGYSPGDPFPEDQALRDGLSSVLENTALFGDLLLRLPDMVHNMLSRNREWDMIMRWGVGLAQLSDVFQETDQKMLNLAAQEMGLVDKDPDYVNPYKDESRELRAKKEREMAEERKREEKKKKRKAKKRGPRLSGMHTEL